MSGNLGISDFQLFTLARRFDILDIAERLQPKVVSQLVKFCETYLAEFNSQYGEGGEEVVVQLVKQFDKLKADQIAKLEMEKGSLEQTKKSLQAQVDAFQAAKTSESAGRASRSLNIHTNRMVNRIAVLTNEAHEREGSCHPIRYAALVGHQLTTVTAAFNGHFFTVRIILGMIRLISIEL